MYVCVCVFVCVRGWGRYDRNLNTGEAIALWPMPADQVRHTVLDDGSAVYEYRIGSDVAVLAEASVLHEPNAAL